MKIESKQEQKQARLGLPGVSRLHEVNLHIANKAYLCLLFISVMLFVTSCKDDDPGNPSDPSVSFDNPDTLMLSDETITLIPVFSNDQAAQKEYQWSSSNPEIAAVEEGVVTAEKTGNVIITIEATDGSISASCTVAIGVGNDSYIIYLKDVEGIKQLVYREWSGEEENQLTSSSEDNTDLELIEGVIVRYNRSSKEYYQEIGIFTEKQLLRRIDFWGDSLTAGAGGNGKTYPGTIGQLAGDDYQIANRGVGGENTLTIAGRQGGIPMMIENSVELPADSTPVVIGDAGNSGLISSWNNDNVNPLRQGGAATINNCLIDSVECILDWTGSSHNDPEGKYTLQRVTAGDNPVTLPAGTTVVTSSMREYFKPYINVLFIGQNGGYDGLDDLVAQYRAMITFGETEQYVVLGLTTGDSESRAALEQKMLDEFGDKYINLREYLSTEGLNDAGITPTQEDTDAMALGETPPSLLADAVHLNAAGYTVVGNFVYQKLTELGWLD